MFADASRSVGLVGAPSPGSVPATVFHGERSCEQTEVALHGGSGRAYSEYHENEKEKTHEKARQFFVSVSAGTDHVHEQSKNPLVVQFTRKACTVPTTTISPDMVKIAPLVSHAPGTSYPSQVLQDAGASYHSTVDGASYPSPHVSHESGASYSLSDSGASYPISESGASYPSSDSGASCPISDRGASYPSIDRGASYPVREHGASYPSTADGASYPVRHSNNGASYPSSDRGASYPLSKHGASYPSTEHRVSNPFSNHGASYPVARTTHEISTRSSAPDTEKHTDLSRGAFQFSGSAAAPPPNGGDELERSDADLVKRWYLGKGELENTGLTEKEKEDVLYRLANTCTNLTLRHRGRIGDVARAIGGPLVTPPVDPNEVRMYFGGVKSFPQIDQLVDIVSTGVPVGATVTVPPSHENLEHALQYAVCATTAAEHLNGRTPRETNECVRRRYRNERTPRSRTGYSVI